MSFIRRLLRRPAAPREALVPLYRAVVAEARNPDWYRAGAVPDTFDGRFDMVAAVLATVLIRLERTGGQAEAALLTEVFIDDMDGQLRERGIGDLIVGKHIGKMISALGGRLDAYRAGLDGAADLAAALARNLYRGEAVAPDALAHAAARLRTLHIALERRAKDALVGGALR